MVGFVMKRSPVYSDDICEDICATLRAAIFEGELKPGDKLVEETIARHFRTSRTVVRGALSMLAQQSLAERRRNHGSFVAAPGETEARNLLATRRMLEIAVMDTINGKVGPKEFDRLERAIEREKQVHAGQDPAAKKRIAGDFHYLLAEFAGMWLEPDAREHPDPPFAGQRTLRTTDGLLLRHRAPRGDRVAAEAGRPRRGARRNGAAPRRH